MIRIIANTFRLNPIIFTHSQTYNFGMLSDKLQDNQSKKQQ